MSKNLPVWSREIIDLYESHSHNQFILHGNVGDRFQLPGKELRLGGLTDFLEEVLLPGFDVIFSYDLGNGLRIEKGGALVSEWPFHKENPELPKTPRAAIETLTRYFRYLSNLTSMGRKSPQVGCYIRSVNLMTPALQGSFHHDISAMALLMKDWSTDDVFQRIPLFTCLIAENLSDLHSLLANNSRAARIKIPLPSEDELRHFFGMARARFPVALKTLADQQDSLVTSLAGSSLCAIENLLNINEHRKSELASEHLSELKREMVEQECGGLIEFIQSDRSLDQIHAQDALKNRLREDIRLWNSGDTRALPMGYLLCGPVGIGKTFLVECLAGEAGVPVVKIKNFRDKWIGSTEGNLETIFRLIQSLNRCFVFIDEADQSLGRRDAGNSDAGLSGRVYSMFAKEMSNPSNRGRVIWILASSRPDLIEVDLKRPGRVDVKIPIFPTASVEESFALIQSLCKRMEIEIGEPDFELLKSFWPTELTPGAAEVIATKAYRLVHTREMTPRDALHEILRDYQHPVAREIMNHQIRLAIEESTDIAFIPDFYRQPKEAE